MYEYISAKIHKYTNTETHKKVKHQINKNSKSIKAKIKE